jgi:hypothetical protein
MKVRNVRFVPLEEAIRRKIEDLMRRAGGLGGAPRNSAQVAQSEGWITEALNVIEVAIPIENNAYRRRIRGIVEGGGGGATNKVSSIAECLRALLPDIAAGLIANFGNTVRAETFDDFLDHAETYRQEGERQAAGVLAGVVFEDTIRRICRDQNIPEKDEDLEKLINALTRQTVITGQQSKQAKVTAHVRAKATHAQWDEYDLHGVAETIQLTRTFLREHLGG